MASVFKIQATISHYAQRQCVFAMAGIWNHPATAGVSPTFAVLTTEPNPFIRKIRDRMPFILQRKQEDMWLREIGNGVVSLVQTQMGAEEMKYHAVTPKMNKVAFENPQAIEPIPEPSLGL